MSDNLVTFPISWEECLRLRPLMKTQKEPMEIEGAPPGKWWLKTMEIKMTPETGIDVQLTVRPSEPE